MAYSLTEGGVHFARHLLAFEHPNAGLHARAHLDQLGTRHLHSYLPIHRALRLYLDLDLEPSWVRLVGRPANWAARLDIPEP